MATRQERHRLPQPIAMRMRRHGVSGGHLNSLALGGRPPATSLRKRRAAPTTTIAGDWLQSSALPLTASVQVPAVRRGHGIRGDGARDPKCHVTARSACGGQGGVHRRAGVVWRIHLKLQSSGTPAGRRGWVQGCRAWHLCQTRSASRLVDEHGATLGARPSWHAEHVGRPASAGRQTK